MAVIVDVLPVVLDGFALQVIAASFGVKFTATLQVKFVYSAFTFAVFKTPSTIASWQVNTVLATPSLSVLALLGLNVPLSVEKFTLAPEIGLLLVSLRMAVIVDVSIPLSG